MTAPVVPSVKVKMNSFVTSSYDKLTDSPLLLSPADTTLDLRKQTWTIPSFLPGDLVPPWWDTSPYLTPRLDWRQCGNSLALCYLTVVMELPDS